MPNWVRRIDAAGVVTTFATTPSGIRGLAADESGNLYVGSDRQLNRIDTAGTIPVIAGVAADGYGGDGGPAHSAGLSVSGIAVDRFGDLSLAGT